MQTLLYLRFENIKIDRINVDAPEVNSAMLENGLENLECKSLGTKNVENEKYRKQKNRLHN